LTERLPILDIWVDPVTRESAIERVQGFLRDGDRAHSVFASNPEKHFSVPKDPVLYAMYQNADLLLPDGIGVVLAARLLYGVTINRVPGSEFIFAICELVAREGYPVFLYGATETVSRMTAAKLEAKYPGIQIVGRSNGYVQDADMPELVDRINASKAAILFLALGSPKQEQWFATYKGALKYVRVCQGVGGTLDTIAGTVKRAPVIWRRFSLEWCYRLLSEPKRIRRQKMLPVFAGMVVREKLRQLARAHRAAAKTS